MNQSVPRTAQNSPLISSPLSIGCPEGGALCGVKVGLHASLKRSICGAGGNDACPQGGTGMESYGIFKLVFGLTLSLVTIYAVAKEVQWFRRARNGKG